MPAPRLLCFGLGYSARVFARRQKALGWSVAGTSRDPATRAALAAEGFIMLPFDAATPLPADALAGVTHVLASIPPGEEGDPALRLHGAALEALPSLAWIGYLSTTGVYGDHGGGWVDEDTPLAPDLARSRQRAVAERGWLGLRAPVHVFRLAGIYGPGRSAFTQIRAGTARRLVKPGQVFCRIHVEDIAAVLAASIARPHPGRVYNVCDDEPAPPQDVVAHACTLAGVAPPPEEPYAPERLSAMARSFYADNRRVRNGRIKAELGVRLRYPTYREGLAAILAAGE